MNYVRCFQNIIKRKKTLDVQVYIFLVTSMPCGFHIFPFWALSDRWKYIFWVLRTHRNFTERLKRNHDKPAKSLAETQQSRTQCRGDAVVGWGLTVRREKKRPGSCFKKAVTLWSQGPSLFFRQKGGTPTFLRSSLRPFTSCIQCLSM